jgi:methionine aminopeptidase
MGTPISKSPIRVFHDGEYWRVDYGSYADGFHATRAEAVAVATVAAAREHRTLETETAG